MNLKLVLGCFSLAFCISCASQALLSKDEYAPSKAALEKNQTTEAQASFPPQESGGFITSIEKGWLKMLEGKADPQPLLKISDGLENREMILVSREMGRFFYQETEDGYYPAEHEIIWLHLVTGMHFALNGDRQGARVEAQRAAERLQGREDSKTGDFDDAILRLWLASLWIYCDEWEHARVDLRLAAKLNPELSWAKTLAEREQAPAQFNLIFEGTGPEPIWKPESIGAKLTGQNSLKFPLKLKATTIQSENLKTKKAENLSAMSTAGWYARHQKRNTEIREVLEKSKYMVKMGAVETSTAAGKGVVATVTGAAYVAGITVAAAAIGGALWLMSQGGGTSTSGETYAYIMGGGLALGGSMIQEGDRFWRRNSADLDNYRKRNLDVSDSYRFVRFIPDWLSANATTTTQTLKISTADGSELKPFAQLSDSKKQTQMRFYFIP